MTPGETQTDELLLDLGPPVVEDQADYRSEGHHRLHGQAGREVDRAHEDAHGGHPEKETRELEPLEPREAASHPAHARVGRPASYG